VSRVIFPIGAGILIDQFGSGVPFWIAALLVLATFPLTAAMETYLAPTRLAPEPPIEEQISSADVTAELPTAPRT